MRHTPFKLLAVLTMAAVAASCGSDAESSADIVTNPTTTTTIAATTTTTVPSTVQGRLAQAYPDATVDPSAAAWQALLDDTTLDQTAVSVIEFAGTADDTARASYTAYIDAVREATVAKGGSFAAITDVWRPGLELPIGFDGGMVWAATYPSRDVFIEVVLEPAVVAAAASRRDAVRDPHLFIGVNLVPQFLLDQEAPADVEALPHDLVRGRDTAAVVDELLSIYPAGGSDPTKPMLEAMLARDDARTQAVTYVNLYRFGPDTGGAASINEYNMNAMPFVLAHGARPKVIVNVAQQLLGSQRWDRVILVRWPSIEVFTDLRLTPGYVDAQTSRVESSDAYGNLVTIDRADSK
ncbi:MAG: hypothetical protein F2681_17435 [Actinobacteria bacterium]|uniref:Unannotated protein n=1 Tax=freshwater metagenome TaxID=449393 RepID=A0A6J6ABX4_9ZZZZ|nr:hypothetical protein [Actinomycetota bacterium]MSX54766.1 hypothetical protein [Actinomycetota bacterium]MSX94179.1 hypothetical protein [Actinomycetota bacterium]MSZ84916.1 hypothetical protein [Actinomycetota bacterium]MTB19693.1 hypothetical protein [Actinomycetota bacterium]